MANITIREVEFLLQNYIVPTDSDQMCKHSRKSGAKSRCHCSCPQAWSYRPSLTVLLLTSGGVRSKITSAVLSSQSKNRTVWVYSVPQMWGASKCASLTSLSLAGICTAVTSLCGWIRPSPCTSWPASTACGACSRVWPSIWPNICRANLRRATWSAGTTTRYKSGTWPCGTAACSTWPGTWLRCCRVENGAPSVKTCSSPCSSALTSFCRASWSSTRPWRPGLARTSLSVQQWKLPWRRFDTAWSPRSTSSVFRSNPTSCWSITSPSVIYSI